VNAASAVSVLSLITNQPPRFRLDPARPYFLANIGIINLLRATTAFTAATASIVDHSTTPPKVFGIPVEESSDMDSSNATGGHKNLLLMDAESTLLVEKLGTQVLYEPMVNTATAHVLSRRSSRTLGP
jgi:Phage capsid family